MSDNAVPYPKRALQSTLDKLKLYNKDIYPDTSPKPVGDIPNVNDNGRDLKAVTLHRERMELFLRLHNLIPGEPEYKPYKNWPYQSWFRDPPSTEIEINGYIADIERLSTELRNNPRAVSDIDKRLLGKLVVERRTELEQIRRAIRNGRLGIIYRPEIYPANFYTFDTSYRDNITETLDNFHLESWFNTNPRDYNETKAFLTARNLKSNEVNTKLTGAEKTRQAALLDKRRNELLTIQSAIVYDSRLYSTDRWPKLGRHNYIPETEVEIYTPKDSVELVGKDLTIQSFAGAYNTLVADKLNSLFKQSADFLFNDAAPSVKPSAWEIPAYKAILDKIKLHLDNPVDGDFGIMQASNVIIPEALKNTVNSDEVKSQYYIDNNEPSIKNVMKALDNSITMLSRIRKFSVRIIYQPPGGATQDLGLFEVYRLLTLDWAFPDLYKEFYRVGEDITEANVTKLFNDIYKELIKIINGEREIPNPKPGVNYQGLNNLTLYFAPGRMLSSDEIVRGK